MKKQIIAIPEKPALFLVPTRQLVVQQACALRHDMNMRVAEFKGGSATPVGFQVTLCLQYCKQFAVIQALARCFHTRQRSEYSS
jgi:hypothetical protein